MKPGRYSEAMRLAVHLAFENLDAREVEVPPEDEELEEETPEEQEERISAVMAWAKGAAKGGSRER